jgi:hypothetical protein
MNDNHKGGAKILPFGVPKEIEGPSGQFHTVNVWQCTCGGAVFSYSREFGLVCYACDKAQTGFSDG